MPPRSIAPVIACDKRAHTSGPGCTCTTPRRNGWCMCTTPRRDGWCPLNLVMGGARPCGWWGLPGKMSATSVKGRVLDLNVARSTARRIHAGQRTRSGEPVIQHVGRVARAVPRDVRALAYLHDVLEQSETTLSQLRTVGLRRADRPVLELLTRGGGEPYETYVMRIAVARGRVGRIARTIKAADLDDHLSRVPGPGAPDYAWARAQITAAQQRHGEPLQPLAVARAAA